MSLRKRLLMTKIPTDRLFSRISRAALFAVLCGVSLLTGGVSAEPAPPPLANAVILIIRHAEKPDQGAGLTVAGQQRASAYPSYFSRVLIDGHPVHLDHLIAAADTPHSQRPRLTLTPLSIALHLPLDDQIPDKEVGLLGGDAAFPSRRAGHFDLLASQRNPGTASGSGSRPVGAAARRQVAGYSVFGWIIQLRYDRSGASDPKLRQAHQ